MLPRNGTQAGRRQMPRVAACEPLCGMRRGRGDPLPTQVEEGPNLPFLCENEGYGAWNNEKQEKITTLLERRDGHNCPQCRQFQAFQRAFLLTGNSGRNALFGTSLTVPRTLRQL